MLASSGHFGDGRRRNVLKLVFCRKNNFKEENILRRVKGNFIPLCEKKRIQLNWRSYGRNSHMDMDAKSWVLLFFSFFQVLSYSGTSVVSK